MSTVRRYIAEVERRLIVLDRSDRQDILRELEASIRDRARASGTSPSTIVKGMESPGTLARAYIESYGYGRTFIAFLGSLALLLSLLAVPELWYLMVSLTAPSSGAYVALLLLLVWISVRAGRTAGTIIAGGCALLRVALGVLLPLLVAGLAFPDMLTFLLFTISSGVLVLVGPVVGEARRRVDERTPDL